MKTSPFAEARLMLQLFVFVALGAVGAAGAAVTVNLNGNDPGRVFGGIGGVSAGASTRLLADYPEPYRSDVLDFLFKPRFGAGFQHLKVEVGGGENSTCGSEPSHAITREELAHPKARGYEFWLMKEARKRNPKIILDCLPWSYPGWLSGRFSQDSADWFVAFLDVAKKQYGLDVDWISAAQNETGTDRDWIVNILRPTLDARGYRNVKLQAPDNDKDFWHIFDVFETDPPFRNAIQAVGYHYITGREPWTLDEVSHRESTDKARNSGLPLWASEEWSMCGRQWDGALPKEAALGPWRGAGPLYDARIINKVYLADKATTTEIWCPVDSIYDGLPVSDSGACQANQPWSGHYEVWPGVWAVAHTTQFARPGWQYLDGACGQIDPKTWNGSYVTLKDPATGDWSMIVCTGEPAALTVKIGGGLKGGPVHVWKSDAATQFIKQADLKPENGSVALALEGAALYTLTTTTGQHKGSHKTPPAKPFPFPYREDFESYRAGSTPRYFSDQKGSFEVAQEPGHGKCLKQIVPRQGILWGYMRHVLKPYTVIGDDAWTDYALSADVRIAGGDVELGGRFNDEDHLSYRWILAKDGAWKLNYQSTVLASGALNDFDGSVWHSMKLVLSGNEIKGFVDGKMLAQATEGSAQKGMAILASSYDGNLFDNVVISPVDNN